MRILRLLYLVIGTWMMYEAILFLLYNVTPNGTAIGFALGYTLFAQMASYKRSFDIERLMNEFR